VSLAAEDGERRNFHRSARTLPAARGHAGRVNRRYDTAGHCLNSRLCRVPGVRAPEMPPNCHQQPTTGGSVKAGRRRLIAKHHLEAFLAGEP
jgi:hypothetical protein